MTPALKQTLAHLEQLVGFDTRNPPRAITTDGIFGYLQDNLTGFEFELTDLGDGCISLLATRGQPGTLFNFHLDTVPAASTWDGDPFVLRLDGQHATGLGACDIKGATACMLTAAAQTQGELALLFSSDEEAGSSRCIREFLSKQHGFERVVVAEPTNARAVLAHRGIATASMQFAGQAGHASGAAGLESSAVHRAVRWADRALTHAAGNDETYGSLSGMRSNIGRIEGGIKPNIIAPRAELKFGIRTLPGQDGAALLTHFCQLAEPHEVAGFEPGFVAPSLPAQGAYPPADSLALAQSLALPIGEPVDFWTEAALFAAAGITALVFGPGDIAQAHAVNESVALSQLQEVTDIYTGLIQ